MKEEQKKNKRLIEDYKKKVDDYDHLMNDYNENTAKLTKLFELGVINNQGEYLRNRDDPNNRME